jgi:hypothetical protein
LQKFKQTEQIAVHHPVNPSTDRRSKSKLSQEEIVSESFERRYRVREMEAEDIEGVRERMPNIEESVRERERV